jgi:hypothetical protein
VGIIKTINYYSKNSNQKKQPTTMSSFVTIIPKNSGASAPKTVWKQQAGGRSLVDFLTTKQTRKAQHTTSRHKTNTFEVFNMEESAAPAAPSKTWKRAPLGKWGKSTTLVMQSGSFTEKKQATSISVKVKDCRYCHENHDIRNKRGDISCPKLKRKLQWEEEQRTKSQKQHKLGRQQRMAEKQAAAAERLRQKFEVVKIQVEEPEIVSEESDDDAGYDQALQCDEELRSVPTDEELMKAKLLNRIQQVEAELAEAREELESEKTKKTSWADAGDVEDAELRVECLEEQVNRLKKKM